jgi:hypothetical protein
LTCGWPKKKIGKKNKRRKMFAFTAVVVFLLLATSLPGGAQPPPDKRHPPALNPLRRPIFIDLVSSSDDESAQGKLFEEINAG